MPKPFLLRNTYWLMRHGHSEANEAGLIVSSSKSGINQYGLTTTGRQQVLESADDNAALLSRVDRIFSSDFLRTHQTAAIIAEQFNIDLELEPALRERFFGQWEGKSSANYRLVWDADQQDPRHVRWNVESVHHVALRLVEFIHHLDRTSNGCRYLIVSHGDPLQILLTSAVGADLSQHRDMKSLETAECRPLL